MSPSKPGDPEKGKPAAQEQTELEAQASKEAAATEAAAEDAPKPRRRRRKATPQAEGTAAEATGVGKEAAEAATKEGASEPVAERSAAQEPAAEEPAAEELAAEEPAAEEAATEAPAGAAAVEEAAGDEPAAGQAAEAPPRARPSRRRRGSRGAEPDAADTPARAERPARGRRGRPAGELVTVRAHAKYVRTSARKARLVCDHIRGKSVEEARAILAHTPRAVARDWSKLLESAVANAEHNHELVGDDLRIHSVTADEGPTLKRFRPRAYGRATRIRKRTSHLTITLTPKE
jgi:ribosomal protein L22